MTVFRSFHPRLREAIVARLGWSRLRPVQEMAGEAILDGTNAVVLAPTAGGKTEAAVFPILSMLLDKPPDSVGALYIAPIKALLNNQSHRLGLYTEMVGFRHFVWHGDTRAGEKREFLKEPAELLMTTPESLEVMLISSRVPVARLFRDLRFVVIDEVHALAGADRGAHLMSVLERLGRIAGRDLQRIGLSATVGNPWDIASWLGGSSGREGRVVDPPTAPARRQLLVLSRDGIEELARDAAELGKGQKSLFFCQSRSLTEAVAQTMRGRGTDVFVHHSSVSAEERHRAEEMFHKGADACIVCTSTLELGIDVGDLDRVLQANAPSTVGSFLQRMGRTGRREGQVPNTFFLCESTESVLQAMALIELARDGWVEPAILSDRCWPVLVHQLFALTLAHGSITPSAAWEQLHRVPDFRGITKPELAEVVRHLEREGYLYVADGRLALGGKAEQVYGRKNFMELYAVFSSPRLYVVKTASGRELGALEQNFVDRLEEDRSTFLLAGRAWVVSHINHKERRIRVAPAPRGKKPSWGGYLPQFLGFEVCQKIKQILSGERLPDYLHSSAKELVAAQQTEMRPLLGAPGDAMFWAPGEARWWTFAGGRINMTLKLALELLGPWKISTSNFHLTLTGDSVLQGDVAGALRALRTPGFWEDENTVSSMVKRLPPYRLSKFQPALPEWAQREMLQAFMLDEKGARSVLGCDLRI